VKIATGFYVNICLSGTLPRVWNSLGTCTSLIHTKLILVYGFLWKGKQFTDAPHKYVEILLRVHMQQSQNTSYFKIHIPNTSYF